MSTPSTTIYFCQGVRINNKYDHTIYFSSKENQDAYFARKVVWTATAYTYQRKHGTIKIAKNFDEARQWSYLFFTNTATGKKYYYFINDVEYVNESMSELTIELDVMQTYMFDWELLPCFVEREHSQSDRIGANTVDEGLDVGDHANIAIDKVGLSDDIAIMTAATIDINKFYFSDGETVDPIVGSKYDNVFGAFGITATNLTTMWDDFALMLRYLNEKGQTDAIYTMWEYPKKLLTTNSGAYEMVIAEYVTGSKAHTFTAKTRPSTLMGYTPRNNKLRQYPYQYMYATNNNGGACVYRYEWFTSTPTFQVKGNIAPDAVVKLIPQGYNGVDDPSVMYDNALAMTNFPMCAWNNDVYKLWLAQNQNTQNLGFAMSGLKIVGGAAAIVGGVASSAAGVGIAGVGTGVGLISSGVTDISSLLAQRADKEIQPPEAKGTYSGNFNVAHGLMDFTIYHKSIDATHAAIIDDFFTMYGYATRRVKIPNINARPSFNYVKTVGSNVTGDFAMDDIRTINTIFDKGITFWKNGDSIGNYTLENSPA